eukprot:Lankesteria_metandrocarpae@DN2634_c0_g1_i2.p1
MDSSTQLLLNKLVAAVAITVSGIVGALVPVVVTRTRFAAILICFEAAAAGTLFGLAVFHLFLEAAVVLDHLQFGYSLGGTWHNPAQAFTFIGFSLVFLLEYVITIPGFSHNHSHEIEILPQKLEDSLDRDVDSQMPFNTVPVLTDHYDSPTDHTGEVVALKLQESDALDVSGEGSHSESAVVVAVPKKKMGGARSLSSLIALAMHSIFEGVLVGLAPTVSDVWVVALGIIGHKWAEAFALSCQYLADGMSKKSILFHQLLFCGLQPLVVIIGILLRNSNEIVAGVFDALACGTILYVSTSTIFTSFVKHPPTKGVWQTAYVSRYISFVLGSFFMAGVSLIP